MAAESAFEDGKGPAPIWPSISAETRHDTLRTHHWKERTDAITQGVFENVTPWGCAWIIIAIALLYLAILIGLMYDLFPK
jgi:hypothetical protein